MPTTKQLMIIGRILMAAIFLVAGIRKVLTFAPTAGYFGSLGLPMPEVLLPLVILLEIGGAIALIAGWRTEWVAGALGLFTIAAGLMAHKFWAVEPPQFANQLNHLLKNVAMAGGFLILAAASLKQRSDK
jgi:putative oxidoreductase